MVLVALMLHAVVFLGYLIMSSANMSNNQPMDSIPDPPTEATFPSAEVL